MKIKEIGKIVFEKNGNTVFLTDSLKLNEEVEFLNNLFLKMGGKYKVVDVSSAIDNKNKGYGYIETNLPLIIYDKLI